MARGTDAGDAITCITSALHRAKSEFPTGYWFEKQEFMSELIGRSWVTVRSWINNNPSLERPELMKRGGLGVPWRFHVVPFLEELLNIFEHDVEKNIEENVEIRSQLNIVLPNSDRGLSLDKTLKVAAVTMALNKVRIEQKDTTPTQKYIDLFQKMIDETKNAISGLSIAVDPTGKLTPEIHDLIDYHQQKIALELHRRWTRRLDLEREDMGKNRVSGSL